MGCWGAWAAKYQSRWLFIYSFQFLKLCSLWLSTKDSQE